MGKESTVPNNCTKNWIVGFGKQKNIKKRWRENNKR